MVKKIISSNVGSQSVVLILDVKKRLIGGYEIFIKNGTIFTKRDFFSFLDEIKNLPFGDLIINCINLDGTRKGYNFGLVRKIFNYINKPMTILGGAGA